jgi:hypothetical protein
MGHFDMGQMAHFFKWWSGFSQDAGAVKANPAIFFRNRKIR